MPDVRDMIENYMDYSNGSCLELFTQGQKARANTQMQTYRKTLYDNNILYAGIDQWGGYKTPPTTSYKAPVVFNFESNPLTNSVVSVTNLNNPSYGWQYTNSVGYQGSGCMMLPNFNNPSPLTNGRDYFQLPEIDLSAFDNPLMEFYYAWGQRTPTNVDSLIVYASSDFGMTEWRVFAVRGTNLATVPVTGETAFAPADESQWRKAFPTLWMMHKKKNVRLRFEYYNRGGNNIYIDKISFSNGTTGVNEVAKNKINFSFYPNPFDNEATINFELKEKQNVKITLTDLLGREIKIIENKILNADKYEVKLNRNELKQGIYYLQFEAGEQRFSHKILIN